MIRTTPFALPSPFRVLLVFFVVSSLRGFLSLLVALLVAAPAVAQRDLKTIPDPDPELERQTFVLPPGFAVNLYASDPLIAKPIHMNFDEKGRLWIAGSEVYPHILPGQEANDKILVLEDVDGDGRAERTTVFADGLLIPTGVAPGDGGAYVANSTELVHLADTDGDGRADRRRVVLSGFGTEDTHHILHSFRWGPDGMLYMNQSIYIHSHIETPYGVRRLGGGGIWQFRPETRRLEILCRGFVNTWGHHFDRWGQSFATDGAYGEGINYVFPGAVFVTAPGAKRVVKGLNPGSPKHCGLEIAGGRHLPPEWEGSFITCDFRAHRVCRFVPREEGSGYASREETELIKSKHPAFRPIDVKMGPDGAIYVADWYNPIIQHGEVDFRDPRRDHVHGRIWRITYTDRPLVRTPPIAGADISQLLAALQEPEEFTRLHAKRELKSRGADAVVPALRAWLAGLDRADPEFEHRRLEGLWTFQSLDVAEPALLRDVLASPDHRARAAAVRVAAAWRDRLADPLAILRAAVADDHPRVRLEGVRGLAEMESLDAAAAAVLALDRPVDRFLDFALWQAMRDLAPHWLPAVQDGRFDFQGNVPHLTFALNAAEAPGVVSPLLNLVKQDKLPADRAGGVLVLVAGLGGPGELQTVFEFVLGGKTPADDASRAAVLHALVDAAARRKVVPAGDLEKLSSLLAAGDESLRVAAVRAAGAWRLASARVHLSRWAMGGEETAPAVQQAAIEALADLGGKLSETDLSSLAAAGRPYATRRAAIAALVRIHPSLAAARAAETLAAPTDETVPAEIVQPFLARQEGPEALAQALAGAKLPPDTARLAVRAARAAPQPAPALVAAIEKAGGLTAGPRVFTPEEVRQLVADVPAGDPARGEEVYRRKDMACQKCHAVGGVGGLVGPDLVSIGASAPVDYLVESLVAPSAKIKENYHSVLIATDEGRVVTGIVVRQSPAELVLRDAEDHEVVIPVAQIAQKRDGRSLMPDGSVDALTRGELVDLVRFLSELGKSGPYALSKERLARRWQVLAWSSEAHRRLNRTSYVTAARDDPAFTWEPAYTRVAGELPLAGLPTFVVHAGNAPVTFLRTAIDATSGGPVRLKLNSAAGLSMWLDGEPLEARAESVLDLAPGAHTLTLAVDRDARSDALRLELLDVAGSPTQAQFVGGK